MRATTGSRATTAPTSTSARTCTCQPGADTRPYHAYHHSNKVVATDTCPTGSSSIAGLEFEFNSASTYPAEYDDALFFADYSRDCIWVMPKGTNGHPAPGQIRPFVDGGGQPGQPGDGTGRQPVLRRLRRRDDPPHPVHRAPTSHPPRSPAPPRPPAPRPSRSASTAPAPATPIPVTPSATPGTWTATAPTTTPPRPSRPTPTPPAAPMPPPFG